MREIEIKARVGNQQALLGKLQELGVVMSEPVKQHDRVFGQPGVDGGDDNNAPWLRIRTETKGEIITNIFTLKRSVTNQLDSIEHETEIKDEAELERIIHHIGFVPYSDIIKTRRKATIGDIEICIDAVEGLGDFIEAEKLTVDDADYTVVSDELWKVLERFGVSQDDHVDDGYDVLMNKRLADE